MTPSAARQSEPRLIINADDLGISRGVTDAILITHRHGVLTSASLMANMPASAYAIQRLKTAPALAVGIHLNICQGTPILPAKEVPTLVDLDGNFLPPSVMIRRLWRFQASHHEIEAEFRAQIHRLKEQGLELSHADSHHHMHIYPAAVRPFVRALAAEGIHRARASRFFHTSRNRAIAGPHKGNLPRRLLVQCYRNALQSVAFHRIASPDRRIAFAPCSSPHHLLQLWIQAFQALPPGTFELACHPGIPEPHFSQTDAIAAQREQELRVLMDPELGSAIARNHIHLIAYKDLPIVSAPRGHSLAPAPVSMPKQPV